MQLLLKAMIAMLLVFAAAPAAAQDLAQLLREFDAAREQEAVAARAVEQARAAAAQGETAATAAAGADVERRRAQTARLEALEREISAASDIVLNAGQASSALVAERTALQYWYDIFQLTPGNLTERSFASLEIQLAGLAQAGAIEPGERRFRQLRDVRNAIVRISQRIEREIADTGRVTAARETMARLIAERDALLVAIETDDAGSIAGAAGWTDAMIELARRSLALFEAENRVFATYRRYADAVANQRPPSLIGVTVTQSGGGLYRGGWVAEGGGSADEAARQRERDDVVRHRTLLTQQLENNGIERSSLAELRLRLGQDMASRTNLLNASAQRYAALKMRAAYVSLGVEIGVTLAELALTGGTATLVRKTTELAEEAAAKAVERRAIGVLVDNLPPVEKQLLKDLSIGGQSQLEKLGAAARFAEEELLRRAPAMERRLIEEGVPADLAGARVTSEIRRAMENITELHRMMAAATPNSTRQIVLQRTLDELAVSMPSLGTRPSLEVLADGFKENVYAAGAGRLPDVKKWAEKKIYSPEPEIYVEPIASGGNTSNALLGESLEAGFTIGMNTVMATASEGLTGMAKYTDKFGKGMAGNISNLGISAIGSAVEIGAAKMMDEQIDAESAYFAKLLGELDYLMLDYRVELDKDFDLWNNAKKLATEIAAADARLIQLRAGFQQIAPEIANGRAEGDLAIELSFSTPLLAAPTVSAGSVAVPMRRVGSDGRRWSGTVSGEALGAGTHALSVEIDDSASPFGALDSNPATPAVFKRQWAGYEAGADTAHAIRLGAVEQVAEFCPSRMPSNLAQLECRCPANQGGGTVWGTFYYTDDSALCRAAVHAGVIPPGGGDIKVHAEPGRVLYSGSTHNGVASADYGNWPRTIVFDGAKDEAVDRSGADQAYPNCPYGYDARVLGEGGTCRCPDGGGTASVWGTFVYTTDSNICAAARHAGIITEAGGLVRVTRAPGQDGYEGSEQNGVRSAGWGSYPGSYVVSGGY